ncbi:MAG: (Fe-S)-binding protein, partial [Desulfobacterales bacterium]|nr:(Fe-S)-binding protein [Desulfobacterales bacterium]
MQKVSLFIPCIVDQWLPHIGISTAALVKKMGCSPYFRREQTCCGQFLYNAGKPERARKLARRFIEIFGQDEVIVSPSASCVHMVRKIYPLLFEGMPAWRRRAESLAGRVFELCEFMVDQMAVTDVGARFAGKAAFHESCSHLYGLGISRQPRRLLEEVDGMELAAMEGADIFSPP